MPIEPEKVKSIVQRHFEMSVEPYEVHEKNYHIFDELAKHLLLEVGVKEGDHVVEVGCGSGFSTVPLAETVGQDGTIWGVDNSGAMLRSAVKRLQRFGERVKLINIDAGNMNSQIPHGVEHVLFTASIFLIPDVEDALSNSYELLKPGGRIGFNYLDDLMVDGKVLKDMVKEEKPELYPYGKGIADVSKLEERAEAGGFKKVEGGILKRELPKEEARSFYSIPAQSAGLYPREELDERISKVGELFSFASKRGKIEQWWGWWVGERSMDR